MPRQLKSWLQSWEQYLSNTGAPDIFKFWTGVSVLSSTLKRNVIIKTSHHKYSPHMYIILVAEPGIGKDETIDPAKTILTTANYVNKIEDCTNIYAIIEELARGWPVNQVQPSVTGTQSTYAVTLGYDHSALVVVPELITFMNAIPNTMDFMCALWNQSDFTYKTKNKGQAIIKDSSVNLLGGCVPAFIKKMSSNATTEVVTSGFSSRCLFIFGPGKGSHKVFQPLPDIQLEKQLVNDLHEIALIKGDVSFSVNARSWFEQHCTSMQMRASEFDSDVVKNFRARYIAHVFKLATVLTINDKDWLQKQQLNDPANGLGFVVIGQPEIQEAVKRIEEVMGNLDHVFASVGESRFAAGQDLVMRYLARKMTATSAQMYGALRRDVDKSDLELILSSLCLPHCDPPLLLKNTMPGLKDDYYSLSPKGQQFMKQGQQQTKGVGQP